MQCSPIMHPSSLKNWKLIKAVFLKHKTTPPPQGQTKSLDSFVSILFLMFYANENVLALTKNSKKKKRNPPFPYGHFLSFVVIILPSYLSWPGTDPVPSLHPSTSWCRWQYPRLRGEGRAAGSTNPKHHTNKRYTVGRISQKWGVQLVQQVHSIF